jgi:K(+)-stimulated pyrophosphate-energized sodium pump
MMLPGAITIITPIIMGLLLGAEALGAYMAGVTVSGVLWAIFQNNAGGAWDNAKKSFEKGVEINGQTYYKKSEPHKAAVTGDTVGDPFKDTSGPSMNILIKLSSLVGLAIAPLIAVDSSDCICPATEDCSSSNVKSKCCIDDKLTEEEKTVFEKEYKLSNGFSFSTTSEAAVESKLIEFINDESKVADKESWFSFDRLTFETGSDKLVASSQEQLGNIAKILEAFPNVHLEIGGYTDNTGDKAANIKLSDDRANTVLKSLVALGVSAVRLKAEGYGDQYPVSSNDTEEGRAKNRRIDLRVAKK